MSDLVTSKAQNLARIRDNQRRSRARRKEYLQELESKLRSYEQAGIEASSQIQNAARKVLDENRKLRALLHERGVSEQEVVAALAGPSDGSYDQIFSAPALNAVLEQRVTCTTLSSTSSPAPPDTRATSLPRHVPSVASITAPTCCYDSASPSSIVSSMETPPPASYPTPFYTTPMTPTASEIKIEEVRSNYLYDQPYNGSWDYSNNCNVASDHVSYYNTTSCADTTSIVRTTRSDIGPGLDTGFGCRIPDQNIYVNNGLVFSMMDRYLSQHGNV